MVNLGWFRRRNPQPPRIYDKPARERHYLSLVGSVLCIVLLILAVALREWGKASNDFCSYVFGLTQVQIEYIISSNGDTSEVKPMTEYYSTSHQVLISCIISVIALTLVSSVVSTVISAGYPREKLEFLRHYSVFNIVSLLCIVLVAGLWLAVVESLPATSTACHISENQDLRIDFGYAYFLLLVGGLFSLGGASFNLLCARSAAERRRRLRMRFRQQQSTSARRLTDRSPPAYSLVASTDFSETEEETSMSEPEPDTVEPTTPPPAYTP